MDRTLLILPTMDLVEEALAPTPGVFDPERPRAMTLAQLEGAILQPALRGLTRLPSGGRRLALNALLQSAADLPAFRDIARLPGFAKAAEGFLLDLAASGVDPADLERIAPRLPPWLADRAGALARIARSYANRLEERGLADPELLLPQACRALAYGALPPVVRGFRQIVFRHIVDWPPGRILLARSLAAAIRAEGGTVRIELPHAELNDPAEIHDALDPAWDALEKSGADFDLPGRPLRRLATANVRAFTAATDAEEAREIARRVADLLRAGTTIDQIAIGARGMSDLAVGLENALVLRGIRARRRYGPSHAETTIGRLAIDLARWDLPEECTRERVCALLACDMIDIRALSPDAPPPLRMVRHLRAGAIRSRASDRAGADGFASRLERLARSYDAADRTDEAHEVRRTAVTVARLFSRTDRLPVQATLVHHAEELLRLLEELRVPHRLARTSGPSDRALAAEQAAWERLKNTVLEVDLATRALDLAERRLSRRAFADWLASALATGSSRPSVTRGAGVELLELSDLSGRSFQHVFIVGAHEGRLPEPPGSDALFTEEERWLLNDAFGKPVLRVAPSATASSPLPSAAILDAAAVALAAESATVTLTVSRSRADDRGRVRADSPLLSLLAEELTFEAVPYTPLDPILAARTTPSIARRREIALSRAAIFRGERDHDGYSGDVSPLAPLLLPLAAGRKERPWSASALEKLATCSFRYLAEWGWRAKEEDEPDDQAGPLEVGRLAHLAAETAVKAMVKKHRWTHHDSSALDLGLASAGRAIAEAEAATVLGHPELWELTRDRMLRKLRKLLELELERTEQANVHPFGMELSFGLEGAELPTFEIVGVHVAGQIDRVDLGPTALVVLDYKSGKTSYSAKRFGEDVLFDVQLQLPLYVAAMRALLPQAKGLELDAAYVSLRDLQRTKTLREAMGGASLDEIQTRLEEAVATIVAHVRDGHFPVASKSCHGCHLQPVCRIPRPENG